MLRDDPNQIQFANFYLPFSGGLKRSNRWVKLAEMMPWDEVERCYAESLSGSGMGAPAKSGRIAYGAQLIKERLGLTDEETAEQVQENPYLQYFLGLEEFREEALFDSSMMVHFRSRFTQEHQRRINERIIELATASETSQQTSYPKKEDKDNGKNDEPPPSGKLLVDATCAPADVRYPTDLSLLGEAREKTEATIDTFHALLLEQDPKRKKERTYRQKARKQFLSVSKQKKPGPKKIRKAIGQQLGYLRRNLGHLDRMLDGHCGLLSLLSGYQYKCLLVVRELYRQQSQMHEQRSHRMSDRIVSISQPHVRPIVRGKAGKPVEFGAKVSISHQKDGYVTLDVLSWDAYNEGGDLPSQIEGYKTRFGHYPASVHADGIYRTRENRKYCKDLGIRLTGKPLGRPRKVTESNEQELKAQRKQCRQDEIDRIPVEGKFGNAKRKGTLGRVMAKLAHTSESVIHVAIVALNLDTWLRAVLFWIFRVSFERCEALLAGLRMALQDSVGNVLVELPRQPVRN